MEYATRGPVCWFGSQNYRRTVIGFGPQNPGGGPEADGRVVAASRGLRRDEANDEKARWPSDEEITELDHNVLRASWFAHMYLGVVQGSENVFLPCNKKD